LLRAPAREAIRTVAREYTFDELYASKREEAANKMLTRLRDLSQSLAHARQPENARHPVLTIENVLIRRLTPPQQVIEAIERKLQAQQEAERMVFVLQREEREAERKAIEARGIAEFQNTVAQGVTPSLLRWRAIEATRELAESQNAKIVIIGNAGSDGLPIMLPLQ
jgi:regulator of protease activity HflC (stomatin/prohibitin superfamily)